MRGGWRGTSQRHSRLQQLTHTVRKYRFCCTERPSKMYSTDGLSSEVEPTKAVDDHGPSVLRGPQSMQSLPRGHVWYVAPAPPSSQMPSEADSQELLHIVSAQVDCRCASPMPINRSPSAVARAEQSVQSLPTWQRPKLAPNPPSSQSPSLEYSSPIELLHISRQPAQVWGPSAVKHQGTKGPTSSRDGGGATPAVLPLSSLVSYGRRQKLASRPVGSAEQWVAPPMSAEGVGGCTGWERRFRGAEHDHTPPPRAIHTWPHARQERRGGSRWRGGKRREGEKVMVVDHGVGRREKRRRERRERWRRGPLGYASRCARACQWVLLCGEALCDARAGPVQTLEPRGRVVDRPTVVSSVRKRETLGFFSR